MKVKAKKKLFSNQNTSYSSHILSEVSRVIPLLPISVATNKIMEHKERTGTASSSVTFSCQYQGLVTAKAFVASAAAMCI